MHEGCVGATLGSGLKQSLCSGVTPGVFRVHMCCQEYEPWLWHLHLSVFASEYLSCLIDSE